MSEDIDILGTKYKFILVKDEDFPTGEEGQNGGITKFFDKEIIINNDIEKKVEYNWIVRHELLHALFFECGLPEYANDEKLVECFSYHIPKIIKMCKELGVEE